MGAEAGKGPEDSHNVGDVFEKKNLEGSGRRGCARSGFLRLHQCRGCRRRRFRQSKNYFFDFFLPFDLDFLSLPLDLDFLSLPLDLESLDLDLEPLSLPYIWQTVRGDENGG